MKRFLSLVFAALLLTGPAFSQAVQQSGTVTPGHAAQWVTSGVVKDAGSATNGTLTELGITKNGGLPFCVNSAAAGSPRNILCLSTATNGNSTVTVAAQGGATPGNLQFDINGVITTFPATQPAGLVGTSINTQTGSAYTVLATDQTKWIDFTNSGSIAVTLPQAGTAGFTTNWSTVFNVTGSGTATVTPTSGTICGQSFIKVYSKTTVQIISDGTNWQCNQWPVLQNTVNILDFGGSGDGTTDNTAAFNAALTYALANGKTQIYFPSRTSTALYRFASAPNAVSQNIRLVGDGSKLSHLIRDYNPGGITEAFLNVTNGGGLTGLGIYAGAGTTGGRAVAIVNSGTSVGFHTFNDLIISYNAGGSWTYGLYLNGAAATNGLRDMKLENIQIFGDMLVDGVVNIFGTGLYATNVTVAGSAPFGASSDVQLSFYAVSGAISISNAFSFQIDAAYFNYASGITVDAASSGIFTTGSDMPYTSVSNSSANTAIISPKFVDYRNADLSKFKLIQSGSTGAAYDSTPGDGTYGAFLQADSSGQISLDGYSSGGGTTLRLGTNTGGGAVAHGLDMSGTQNMVFGDANNAATYRSLLPANSAQQIWTPVASDLTRNNIAFYLGSADATPPRLRLYKGRGGTSNAIVNSGDGVGTVQFFGADGTTFINAAQIAAFVDGTPGANDMPGRMVFSTVPDGSTTLTEAMRLDSSQRITTASGQIVKTRTVTAAGDVTAAITDYIICVNKTVGAATVVNLFATPATGTILVVKDCKGDAAANNITITPAAGNIDGAGTLVLTTNYQAARLFYNGTQWFTM